MKNAKKLRLTSLNFDKKTLKNLNGGRFSYQGDSHQASCINYTIAIPIPTTTAAPCANYTLTPECH